MAERNIAGDRVVVARCVQVRVSVGARVLVEMSVLAVVRCARETRAREARANTGSVVVHSDVHDKGASVVSVQNFEGVNKKCKVHLCREGRVVDAPVWRRGALDTGGGRQIRQPLKTRKPASRGTEG